MHFALSSAAELLFDQQLWQLFVSYFKTKETALERIGFPPTLRVTIMNFMVDTF